MFMNKLIYEAHLPVPQIYSQVHDHAAVYASIQVAYAVSAGE